MTFDRFNQIWTALVADRPASPKPEGQPLPLDNGVSEETVDALVAASNGDFAFFDEIDARLAAHDATTVQAAINAAVEEALESERKKQQAELTVACEERDLLHEWHSITMAERDEARAWVERLQKTTQTLTCVYCGKEYPPNTPASGSPALTEHIKTCEKHPMRLLEEKNKRLSWALTIILQFFTDYSGQKISIWKDGAVLNQNIKTARSILSECGPTET
jgi:hypothetical protein